MANEILQKSRATITAQASGALAAGFDPSSGSYTGGAATPIDNTYDAGTENSKGSEWVNLQLNVTATAHATLPATAQVWFRGSEDGTNFTRWKYSHTVGDSILAATIALYDAGMFQLSYQYTELKVMAISYGFTADLKATPKLMELQ